MSKPKVTTLKKIFLKKIWSIKVISQRSGARFCFIALSAFLFVFNAHCFAQNSIAQQENGQVQTATWQVLAPSFSPATPTTRSAQFEEPHTSNNNAGAIQQTSSVSSPPSVSPPQRQVIDPNTLVLNAIHQAVFGSTFSCKVYQQSVAFGQNVVLSGEYKSAGNGTGQFRYTARVSSGDTTIDYVQTSDGRLMYSQMGKQPPRIVNVEKIREAIAPRLHMTKDVSETSIHLAIGGHAEMLRSLYQRYNWHTVIAGTSDNVEVWQLLGRLRTERPRISGTARLDSENLGVPTTDDGLPPGVRLTIGRSANSPYFPYSIEYFRMKKDKDGKAVVPVAVSRIRYIDPTYNIPINEADFTIRPDSEADTSIQETDIYFPQ